MMEILFGLMYLLLAPIAGGLLAGIDRKISARMQGRKGPPLLQPFYDLFKLFSKQTEIVNELQIFFAVGFLVFIIFTGVLFFIGGDLLLIFFALTLAGIFLVLCACSANSPYSSMGSQRELMQMMAYEPMVLIVAIGFFKATGSFAVKDIIASHFPAIMYLPGIFLGFMFISTIKLRKSPFDLSTSHHGHQEMVKGITTELSGKMLGIVELSHWYENILIVAIVGLFIVTSAWWSWIIAIAVCAVFYFIEILIDNSEARVKWQMMLKYAWIVTLALGITNLLILKYIK